MNVAIITGAGSGIGRAIALELAKKKTKLVLCGPKISDLEKTGKESNAEFLAVKADVRSSKDIKAVVRKALKKFGRIDTLINNAGIRQIGLVHQITDSEWQKVLDTNLKGAFICAREVLPAMMKQGNGKIINISSINGIQSLPNCSAYCASKAGLNSFTKSLAYEVKRHGIKVFAVCPYSVNTKIHAKLFPQQTNLMAPEYAAKRIVKLLHSRLVRTGSLIIIKKPFWK